MHEAPETDCDGDAVWQLFRRHALAALCLHCRWRSEVTKNETILAEALRDALAYLMRTKLPGSYIAADKIVAALKKVTAPSGEGKP